MTMSRLLLILGILMAYGDAFLHHIEPRKNMWLTWAKQTGTASFCLSLASASDPFRTCLVGFPALYPTEFAKYSSQNCSEAQNVSHCSALLLNGLNVSLPWDPQELDLLGSQRVNESATGCIIFGNYQFNMNDTITWLTPRQYPYWNATAMCGPNMQYGWGPGHIHMWTNESEMALPPNVFLICGDRVWQGIPKRAYGGPCYLGKLTLFAPNASLVHAIHQEMQSQLKTKKQKRSLSTLSSDCNDNVELFDFTSNFFLSLIAPWGAAHSLRSIEKLACWVVKQANVTTDVLSQLAEDTDSLRHQLLQDRAAIDFLLLAHGHGCEDFEEMCCFNVSTHSESIQKKLQWLKDHTNKIVVNSNPLDSWLRSLGLGPWVVNIVKYAIGIFAGILIIMLLVLCLLGCVQNMITKTMTKMWQSNLLLQKQNGGSVENISSEWLQSKGHDSVDFVKV